MKWNIEWGKINKNGCYNNIQDFRVLSAIVILPTTPKYFECCDGILSASFFYTVSREVTKLWVK